MFDCVICNTTYKRIDALRIHFASISHRNKVCLSKVSNSNNHKNNLVNSSNNVQSIAAENHINGISDTKYITTEMGATELLEPTEMGVTELHEPTEMGATELHEPVENMAYKCVGCNKDYSKQPNLSRHHKKCNIFKDAKKLTDYTGMDINTSVMLIKQKNYNKVMPKKKYIPMTDEEFKTYMGITNSKKPNNQVANITNNNTNNNTNNIQNNNTNNNNTNNITINNNNIMVGNWETISYVRPTNYENMSLLNDEKNKLLLLASGYHAFKTLLDLIYANTENMNIHIINRKKNYVKILTVEGEVKVVSASTAYDMITDKLIDIIDSFIDASEPLIKAHPMYKAGIEALKKSHNWEGEGNNRYPEYRRYIELIVENIGKKSAINLIRFENDIQQILKNGGIVNFNKDTLIVAEVLMTQMIQDDDKPNNNDQILGY